LKGEVCDVFASLLGEGEVGSTGEFVISRDNPRVLRYGRREAGPIRQQAYGPSTLVKSCHSVGAELTCRRCLAHAAAFKC
jgi:hypothetical protein